MERAQGSYVIDPDVITFGDPIINKQLIGIGAVHRDFKVRNADNMYHRKLLRLEDKLYEIDHEIYVLDYLKSQIDSKGLLACDKKIKHFENMADYLSTCKDEGEFLAYLDERKDELEKSRVNIALTLRTKTPLLTKKTYDQKTQNGLYYDAYDFNISSLDCMYDYLQRETFEYHKDIDWVYDISKVNHLKTRKDNRTRNQENVNTGLNSRNGKQIDPPAENRRIEVENTKKTDDMLSVYSIEHSHSQEEVIQSAKHDGKIMVKNMKTLMRNWQTNNDKLAYGDLGDLKKLISLDFSNTHVLNLTIELLVLRNDYTVFLSKLQVT